VLWLASKRDPSLVREQRTMLYEHLLAPLGVSPAPQGVEQAVSGYLAAREQAERTFRVRIDRALGDEVLAGLRRSGYDVP
jgi:hypothetical protein